MLPELFGILLHPAIADDVITIEDGARSVSTDFHGLLFRKSCLDHVSQSRAPQIVKQGLLDSCGFASRGPLWVVKKLSDLEMTELRRTKDSTVHGELQGWPEFGGLGSLATPFNVGIIPR